VNSFSFGNEYEVSSPAIRRTIMMMIGNGDAHSFTIGATIVIDRAIMPAVPTEVFRCCGGNILSSVNEH